MSKHILVFDSGLGGTHILQALQQQLPDNCYSYALDNAAFPYGDKTDRFLVERSISLFQRLIDESQPDLVIIACNTASTLLLEPLRAAHSKPFIGVVPAIKPAAKISRSKVLALLATPATINRTYIDKLIQAHAAACQVVRYSHPDLVMLAENKLTGVAVNKQQMQEILKPLKQHPLANKIDTFVLGCTHFSAIQEELAAAWQADALWLDSTDAIVRRTGQLLGQINDNRRQASGCIYMTSATNKDILLKSLEMHKLSECRIIEMG